MEEKGGGGGREMGRVGLKMEEKGGKGGGWEREEGGKGGVLLFISLKYLFFSPPFLLSLLFSCLLPLLLFLLLHLLVQKWHLSHWYEHCIPWRAVGVPLSIKGSIIFLFLFHRLHPNPHPLLEVGVTYKFHNPSLSSYQHLLSRIEHRSGEEVTGGRKSE